MSFGFGFGLPRAPLRGRPLVAAIRSLFAANEPGVWYDPSDLSTLFQDAAGTTPVTAVEQPVGLMLDKSKGLALGPELVTNGDFSDGTTGWTLASGASLVGGTIQAVSIAQFANIVRQSLSLVSGRWYAITYTISEYVSGAVEPRFTVGNNASGTTRNSNGTFTEYFLSRGTTTFGIQAAIAGTSLTIDNISVREIPGNHAYQTTATSRPVLSARYNLLTKTEQFDDAAWVKNGATVTANAAVAPDGTVTADRVTTSATDGLVYLPTYANSYPQPIAFSVCAKADASSSLTIQFTSSGNGRGATFDLNAGTCTAVVAIGTGTGVSGGVSSIAALGGNWYRCTISDISVTDLWFPVFNVVGPSNSSIYIWGASLVPANQASLPYQRVNTATDYDADPAKFPHYLRFDGVDDWLVTNTITPGTDKVQVFAGVRKLSDAATGIVAELSSNWNINPGLVFIAAPSTTFAYGSGSRGGSPASAAQVATTSVGISPDTAVLAATHDIASGLSTIRRNGVAGTDGTGGKGAGNFLAYPLYIGRRGGTSLPFNGHLYSLIVRFGPNLPIETIEKTEKYINTKTRAF